MNKRSCCHLIQQIPFSDSDLLIQEKKKRCSRHFVKLYPSAVGGPVDKQRQHLANPHET